MVVFYSTLQNHIQYQLQSVTSSDNHVPTLPSADSTTSSIFATCLVQALVYTLIVIVFVGMRLGTLRIYSTTDPHDPTEVVYNHRETDERVFEVNFLVVL